MVYKYSKYFDKLIEYIFSDISKAALISRGIFKLFGILLHLFISPIYRVL